MSEEGHAHPNYVAVWVWLVVLLFLSLACGFIGNAVIATTLVFGMAAVKAFLVGSNFMHLKYEPGFVKAIALGGVVCIVLVIVVLIPDIVHGSGTRFVR